MNFVNRGHTYTHRAILEDFRGISNISASHFGQSSVWPAGQRLLLCTLPSLGLSVTEMSISQRLYINPSISYCACTTMTLFISTVPENSPDIIYSIPRPLRECRGAEEQWDLNRTCKHRPHTWRYKHEAAIWWSFFVVNVSENYIKRSRLKQV